MNEMFNIVILSRSPWYEKFMHYMHNKLQGSTIVFSRSIVDLKKKLQRIEPHLFISELYLDGHSFFEASEIIKSKNEYCSCLLIDNRFKSESTSRLFTQLGILDCISTTDYESLLMQILKERAHQIGNSHGARGQFYKNSRVDSEGEDIALVLTDSDGNIEWPNEEMEKICGYTTEDFNGNKPGHVLQGPLTNGYTVQMIREKLASKSSFDCTLVNYHADGHPYWVSLNIIPLIFEDQSHKFLAVEVDISNLMPALT